MAKIDNPQMTKNQKSKKSVWRYWDEEATDKKN